MTAILAALGLVGSFFLLGIGVARPRNFIYVVLLVKPFIDLTVNERLDVASSTFNALALSGTFVCLVAFGLYLTRSREPVFNHGLMWIFIGLNLARGIAAFAAGDVEIMPVLEKAVRLMDAYLLYFVARDYLFREYSVEQVSRAIWLTCTAVGLVTILAYLSGNYQFDETRGVTRVGGFFNDPGTPSYTAVFSLVFATLCFELRRRRGAPIEALDKVLILFTAAVFIAVFGLTLTKSAFLMLAVFVTLWWGVFKRKILIVLPGMAAVAWLAYSQSESMQTRFQEEATLITQGALSVEAAREVSLGTGRLSRWDRLIASYTDDFTPAQQLFGTYRTFAAHNQYLGYLLEIGLVGLALFVLIILRFYARLIALYRKTRTVEIGMTIVFLTIFCVYSITGNPFYYTTLLWYLMLMLATVNLPLSEGAPVAAPTASRAALASPHPGRRLVGRPAPPLTGARTRRSP